MDVPFRDRVEAGQALAEALQAYRGREDVLVLGLPRGGVPVAYEVATALGAPLDIVLVHKLGTPGQEELAMGAISSGGIRVLNEYVVEHLGIDEATVEAAAEKELVELNRRERAFRGDRPAPPVAGRCVILVDDGLATGSTMKAAVQAISQLGPAEVVVAVPVAPPETVAEFRRLVHRVVCLAAPEHFLSISRWYQSFPQTPDSQVRDLLERAQRRGAAPA